MSKIYSDGSYLENNPSWHKEDSAWKASNIYRIIKANSISFNTITEVGCGSGNVLIELDQLVDNSKIRYDGYDISPQAIEIAKKENNKNVTFHHLDLFSENNENKIDILLVIDVFEHIPDYMGFVEKCKNKAKYKIFHIPLDLHASSLVRNSFINTRYSIGHLHYFTADSAICTLKDTGHEIIDYFYTNTAIDLFVKHPSVKKAIANVPRFILQKINIPFAARILGGYSLLVLTE